MGLDPDVVTRKTFENSFRGYDPMEVQAYLLVLADELRAGRDREFELELRLSEADRRAREAQTEAARLSNQPPPPGPPSLDDLDHAELSRLLGDEMARVLEAARTGAADIVARADAEAEATVAEAAARARARLEVADEEADRRLEENEREVSALRREADADASELRNAVLAEVEAGREQLATHLAEAREVAERELLEQRAALEDALTARRLAVETEIEEVRSQAIAESTALRGDAEAEQAAVMEATRALVREAREFRKEVLTELSARRHAARAQLEQLAAARDHLVEALGTTRATLDSLYGSTDALLDAARERADVAREAAESEAPASVDELDAFLVVRRGDAPPPVERAEPETAEVDEPSDADEPSAVDEPSEVEVTVVAEAEPQSEGDPEPEPEVVTSLFARIRADADAFTPLTPVAEAPSAETGEPSEADVDPPAPLLAVVPEPEAIDLEAVVAAAEADNALLDRRSRALAGPERGLGRVLKRLLSEEQNELLDAVRRTRHIPTLDELLGNEDAHAVRYAKAARAELRDAAYAGAHLLDATAGGIERPEVDDLASQLGIDIVSPLRERLEGCWADASANEVELIELARGTYRQWRTKVLPELLQQYVALSFNRGLTAASGAAAERWLVDAG